MDSFRPVGSLSQAIAISAILLAGGLLTGCTLCQDCGDLDYPTYGGAWERTRRDSGRVGSIFDPAGARTAKLTDREAEQDASGRPSAQVAPEAEDDGAEASGPDDPKSERKGNGEPSPSDRQGDAENRLRDLDLDDIDADVGELLPPDI